jgi:hypothetical protein
MMGCACMPYASKVKHSRSFSHKLWQSQSVSAHALPPHICVANGQSKKDVPSPGSTPQVLSSNMHGADAGALRTIRRKHFPAGELDDGGGALPPPAAGLLASAAEEEQAAAEAAGKPGSETGSQPGGGLAAALARIDALVRAMPPPGSPAAVAMAMQGGRGGDDDSAVPARAMTPLELMAGLRGEDSETGFPGADPGGTSSLGDAAPLARAEGAAEGDGATPPLAQQMSGQAAMEQSLRAGSPRHARAGLLTLASQLAAAAGGDQLLTARACAEWIAAHARVPAPAAATQRSARDSSISVSSSSSGGDREDSEAASALAAGLACVDSPLFPEASGGGAAERALMRSQPGTWAERAAFLFVLLSKVRAGLPGHSPGCGPAWTFTRVRAYLGNCLEERSAV